jgi:hypothetical protein
MLKIILHKSLNHLLFILMAVQKPASSAVMTQVARKYDLVYRFASGSGDSRLSSFAKFRETYKYSSVNVTSWNEVRRLLK